mmetsp:Transcript_11450/g.16376  ORF Transcript_11450/g.16376 Transcript_11450/m.16376 type:complete len:85 (-) Transcript_11450:371-625(-)
MFNLLSANRTLDANWAQTVYSRSESSALSSADALYVPSSIASESLSTIIQGRMPKAATPKAVAPNCSGVNAVACAFSDKPNSKH